MSEPFQTILILGVTGSFGAAMARFLLDHTAATIRGLSRDEYKQHILAHELKNARMRLLLGDIRDIHRLEDAMEGVDLVIHGAALKQVPSGEYNIGELLRTNIIGTENVTIAARRCNVGKVVFISTDKAVAARNSYGLSKGMAERIVTQANGYAPYGTHYCCVRYGNVHGSRGSVVELWRTALEAGLPMKVTDVTMTRFFLTLDDAVRTAWTAACLAPRGGILIPHLPAYTIEDLCVAMETLYARAETCREVIGPRIGEKFHEDLAAPDECGRLAIYSHDRKTPAYYCVMPEAPTWETLPITEWPVRFSEGGMWYKGGLDGTYNSGTWPFRLTVSDLVARIQEA